MGGHTDLEFPLASPLRLFFPVYFLASAHCNSLFGGVLDPPFFFDFFYGLLDYISAKRPPQVARSGLVPVLSSRKIRAFPSPSLLS